MKFNKNKKIILVVVCTAILTLFFIFVMPLLVYQKPFIWCHLDFSGSHEHCHTYYERAHLH